MVVLPAVDRFCMMQWLPCCRTRRKPCDCKIRQTSSPESTRRLPNRYLDLRDKDLRLHPAVDLFLRSGLEEQCQRLHEIRTRFLDRGSLADDVNFGTESDETVVLALNDRGQAARVV